MPKYKGPSFFILREMGQTSAQLTSNYLRNRIIGLLQQALKPEISTAQKADIYSEVIVCCYRGLVEKPLLKVGSSAEQTEQVYQEFMEYYFKQDKAMEQKQAIKNLNFVYFSYILDSAVKELIKNECFEAILDLMKKGIPYLLNAVLESEELVLFFIENKKLLMSSAKQTDYILWFFNAYIMDWQGEFIEAFKEFNRLSHQDFDKEIAAMSIQMILRNLGVDIIINKAAVLAVEKYLDNDGSSSSDFVNKLYARLQELQNAGSVHANFELGRLAKENFKMTKGVVENNKQAVAFYLKSYFLHNPVEGGLWLKNALVDALFDDKDFLKKVQNINPGFLESIRWENQMAVVCLDGNYINQYRDLIEHVRNKKFKLMQEFMEYPQIAILSKLQTFLEYENHNCESCDNYDVPFKKFKSN